MLPPKLLCWNIHIAGIYVLRLLSEDIIPWFWHLKPKSREAKRPVKVVEQILNPGLFLSNCAAERGKESDTKHKASLGVQGLQSMVKALGSI